MLFRGYSVTKKGADSVNKKLVALATSSEDRKSNSRSSIYGQSSTIAANFVKIGLVNVDIIGVTEISKNINKK